MDWMPLIAQVPDVVKLPADWGTLIAQFGAVGVLFYLVAKVLPATTEKYIASQERVATLTETNRAEALQTFRSEMKEVRAAATADRIASRLESKELRDAFREELRDGRSVAQLNHEQCNTHHEILMKQVMEVHHTLRNHRANVEPAYKEFMIDADGQKVPNTMPRMEG